MGYAAAITMLLLPATSCSKAFDDSQWWNELEQIEEDINALKERFNNEINSIKELLDGKIAIRSVETKADGSILVTLTNGSTFTVSPKRKGSVSTSSPPGSSTPPCRQASM